MLKIYIFYAHVRDGYADEIMEEKKQERKEKKG